MNSCVDFSVVAVKKFNLLRLRGGSVALPIFYLSNKPSILQCGGSYKSECNNEEQFEAERVRITQ